MAHIRGHLLRSLAHTDTHLAQMRHRLVHVRPVQRPLHRTKRVYHGRDCHIGVRVAHRDGTHAYSRAAHKMELGWFHIHRQYDHVHNYLHIRQVVDDWGELRWVVIEAKITTKTTTKLNKNDLFHLYLFGVYLIPGC